MIQTGFRFIDGLAPLKLCGRSLEFSEREGQLRLAVVPVGTSDMAPNSQTTLNHVRIPIADSGMAIECFWFTFCDAVYAPSALAIGTASTAEYD